jgi:hypothetical protein
MVGQRFSGEPRQNHKNPVHTAGYTQHDYMAPPQTGFSQLHSEREDPELVSDGGTFEPGSKVVYINPDTSEKPDFKGDKIEVYHESWIEEQEDYPPGAFTTWSPAEKPEFGMSDGAAKAVVAMLDGEEKVVMTDGGRVMEEAVTDGGTMAEISHDYNQAVQSTMERSPSYTGKQGIPVAGFASEISDPEEPEFGYMGDHPM